MESNTIVKNRNKKDVIVNEKEYISPLADIIETKDNFIIELEMPGIDKNNVEINIENDVLTIASNHDFSDKKDAKCITQDFALYNYKRSFSLNNTVNVDKIEAKMENGILKLHLAKSEKLKPKKIAVKSSE